MAWKPIVAGVDLSPEGIRAAVLATRLAQAAEASCYLVHAVRDPWTEASLAQIPMDLSELNRIVLDSARARLVGQLKGKVGERTFDRLDIRFGPAPVVLGEVVDERDAELIVLGGKHHSAVGRWLAGSTTHHMVRTADVPILINGPTDRKIHKVLATVDLSSAARPTLGAAERFAKLFDAKLMVLHVVEPLPLIPELPLGLNEDEILRQSEEELEHSIWPQIGLPGAERAMRRGPAAETIAATAAEWGADLLVVGSHGRGWVDRVLIGSVTERLLNRLPTSMLVIPVGTPAHPMGPRPRVEAKRTQPNHPVRA
jgi:nucleotide-binding universal stress UspA family protein